GGGGRTMKADNRLHTNASSLLRQSIEQLADAAEPLTPAISETIDRFQPFPLKSLPQPVRIFVAAGAAAIGCDPSYIALPLLTALAAAIGNARRVELKRGWTAPPILWTGIVGESGTSKTPAFRLALSAIRKRQSRAFKQHDEEQSEYELAKEHYEKAYTRWKQEKDSTAEPPVKPTQPEAVRYLVKDTTIEALAPLLKA